MARSRRWLALTVALAAMGYVAYSLWHGLAETAAALAGFRWELTAPILALTFVNYGLRYWKWHYLLDRVGASLPHRVNAPIFLTGLAMVITPAKAGELVKPWLVKEAIGAPMLRTVPVLVTERATDGIAVVLLAAVGVSTYQAESTVPLAITLALAATALVVLSIERLSLAILGAIARLPLIGRFGDRLVEMYRAMRTCVAPMPLLLTMLASLVAWMAECAGYWLVFRGLGVEASLGVATFLYASATVLGAPSPGGMGLADAGLIEGARALIPHITDGQAVASALLVRIATLWFGVVLGALVLLRIDGIIRGARATTDSADSAPRPPRDAARR